MLIHTKAIIIATVLIVSAPVQSQEQSWSLAPAKAVMMTFWASMALIGNPDVATMMYRYVALSPMALITAGTATVVWNTITNPTLLLWLKNRASDVTFIPL